MKLVKNIFILSVILGLNSCKDVEQKRVKANEDHGQTFKASDERNDSSQRFWFTEILSKAQSVIKTPVSSNKHEKVSSFSFISMESDGSEDNDDVDFDLYYKDKKICRVVYNQNGKSVYEFRVAQLFDNEYIMSVTSKYSRGLSAIIFTFKGNLYFINRHEYDSYPLFSDARGIGSIMFLDSNLVMTRNVKFYDGRLMYMGFPMSGGLGEVIALPKTEIKLHNSLSFEGLLADLNSMESFEHVGAMKYQLAPAQKGIPIWNWGGLHRFIFK
ncbi:MAG: hypothetical protein K9I36_07325 [Bacteroidia bacterium]|nr:hypothetical protein [Bacteroidia bacterium]MCF8426526.1 hypothetical protein [Bacteroidia bacterium]